MYVCIYIYIYIITKAGMDSIDPGKYDLRIHDDNCTDFRLEPWRWSEDGSSDIYLYNYIYIYIYNYIHTNTHINTTTTNNNTNNIIYIYIYIFINSDIINYILLSLVMP